MVKIKNKLLCVLILSFLCFAMFPEMKANAESQLIMGIYETVNVNPGETKSFIFTSYDNCFYTIETTGKADPFMTIEGGSGGVIFDDNSGLYSNACIGFQGAPQKEFLIKVGVNGNNARQFDLIVRRQKAVYFGSKYNDIDTRADLDIPSSLFANFYGTTKFIDGNSNHFLAYEGGIARNNYEIVMFSGHGGPTSLYFPDEHSITSWQLRDMSRVKLAVWSACNTAQPLTDNQLNITQKAVSQGAKTAIGWANSINVNSSKKFTDNFFKKLYEGATVKEAAEFAKSKIIWIWDKVRDYTIEGSQNIKLTSPEAIRDSYSLSKQLEESVRVYRQIDGYYTNEYYDYKYENGKKVIVESSKFSVDGLQKFSINPTYVNANMKSSITKDGIVYNRLANVENHTVYCNYRNKLIPIQIRYCEYINKIGIKYMDVSCINLNDGQEIDYSEIC